MSHVSAGICHGEDILIGHVLPQAGLDLTVLSFQIGYYIEVRNLSQHCFVTHILWGREIDPYLSPVNCCDTERNEYSHNSKSPLSQFHFSLLTLHYPHYRLWQRLQERDKYIF